MRELQHFVGTEIGQENNEKGKIFGVNVNTVGAVSHSKVYILQIQI